MSNGNARANYSTSISPAPLPAAPNAAQAVADMARRQAQQSGTAAAAQRSNGIAPNVAGPRGNGVKR
jgi:hypothetical protein